jgi:sugar phosphate isomerase/epimerase
MKDYRKLFPFPVGTTSYILPVEEDNLIRNVEFLSDKVDKVQLLLFGKDYLQELLTEKILSRLKEVQDGSGLIFSVHLPLDLDFLHSEKQRKESLSCLEHILDKTEGMQIADYILHLDSPVLKKMPMVGEDLHRRFGEVLQEIRYRFPEQSRRFRIENTYYDLTLFSEEIEEADYTVCMDIGHLALLGLTLEGMVGSFGDRIRETHIHGYFQGQDHRSLAVLNSGSLAQIIDFLKGYAGSTIIEVFNESDLQSSMETLQLAWQAFH